MSPSRSKLALQLEFLEFLKEKNLRMPEAVVEHGLEILDHHASSIGDKVWDIREQVYIAGIDSRQHTDSKRGSKITGCFRDLDKQFPNSNRVALLQGMLYEAQGGEQYSRAVLTYNNILQADPGHAGARKRKVCVLMAQNNITAAIKELNTYVTIFASDIDAWQELTQLYIQTQKLDLAKFCVEELILIQPENYLYHLQYAELNYSLGGNQNYTLAKQYYAQALELKPGNPRAMCGLLLSLRALKSNNAPDVSMYQHVQGELDHVYREKAQPFIADIVHSSLTLETGESANS